MLLTHLFLGFLLSQSSGRANAAKLPDDEPGNLFGFALASVGDVDGDGVGDFLIGEASWKAGASFPGHVRLYSGKSGARLSCWG